MGSAPTLSWALELPGEVLSVRDHLRLRLRPAEDPTPRHPWGTDSRSERVDPDAANFSGYRYTYRADTIRGTVAVLEVRGVSPLFLCESLQLAEAHESGEKGFGYTPLPRPQLADFEWTWSHDAIGVRVLGDGIDLEARLDGLGPARRLVGSHPRDASIEYSGVMREAMSASLRTAGQPVAGAPFQHRGYEPWIGRAAASGAIQLGETFVDRIRAPDVA